MSQNATYDQILARDSAGRARRVAGVAMILAGIGVSVWATGLLDAKRIADAWPAIAQLSSEMFPPD
ncbi:phosphonate ABC transporter, permease protein PhnE, partial [Staphylococcus aureus]